MSDYNQLVDPDILKRSRKWKGYVEAKLGFKNHWYPVLFSNEVEEGQPVTAKVLGENLLINRVDGEVHVIRDKCMHRNVKLSRKLECHTKGSITCWYHGFTYRWSDGKLTNVIAAPNSKIADGTRGIKSFPSQEAKGLVFVFIGDSDFDVPPLSTDLPPNFLDEDKYIMGKRENVKSNWRQGVENGFDTTHIYIHRDAKLIANNNLLLPLGFAPPETPVKGWETHDDPSKPRGIVDSYEGQHLVPAFHGTIEGEKVLEISDTSLEGKNLIPGQISIWMPATLKVDPWPDPSLTQFEFYVPVDAENHMYIQTIGKTVHSEEEKRDFIQEYHSRWKVFGLEDFNSPDIWAREAAEEAYADDYGWIDESLFEADTNILAFRELISKHNRGIQRPEDLRP
tara:strand:- start:10112 stop:11299 length:1188 start_codon:yes stop_codon:yes gene_type:complete